jgi:putative ABC transport system permease protein
MASSWQLGPVLRRVLRHRGTVTFVALQLGIGLAIAVLAVLIGDYFVHINGLPSGLAESELTIVRVQLSGRRDSADLAARRAAIVADVARTPGCTGATVVGQRPLGMFERGPDAVRLTPDSPPSRAFELEAGAGIAHVGGLTLAAGRDFTDADVQNPDVTAALISPQLAHALWRDQSPVGQRFLSRSHGPAIVVGVAATLRTHMIPPEDGNVIYARDNPRSSRLLVLARNAPGQLTALRAELVRRLRVPGQDAVLIAATEHKQRTMLSVHSVVGVLAILVGTIVLVVLIGSMGITYYFVSERTREIGLRRAMGATRRDIIRYFLLESAIYTAAGALVGLAIVLVVLPTLIHQQQSFVTSWPLVVISAVSVVGLNLIATVIPARKAAAVPPIEASRTV